MEELEWTIELKFDEVKKMFDPVITKILNLIREHLNSDKNIEALLLVDGFCESKYLRTRIEKEFKDVLKNKIFVPNHPITAIAKGGNLIFRSIA